jgi:hypothetical protein
MEKNIAEKMSLLHIACENRSSDESLTVLVVAKRLFDVVNKRQNAMNINRVLLEIHRRYLSQVWLKFIGKFKLYLSNYL